MKIHKQGLIPIAIATLIVFAHLAIFLFFTYHIFVFLVLLLLFSIFLFLVVRFFRVPRRIVNRVENGIISPADGTILSTERCFEQEYFKDERIKISIFMSVHNVHVNNYPIDGTVEYVAYHPGKYLVASLPKASFDNEHNTVVVRKDENRVVLFRQIAGFVARRIISYAKEGERVEQGAEMGMIRFGSRVDVFLPLNAQVIVNVGDKVRAKKSLLAYF